jgi:hypothetical protein
MIKSIAGEDLVPSDIDPRELFRILCVAAKYPQPGLPKNGAHVLTAAALIQHGRHSEIFLGQRVTKRRARLQPGSADLRNTWRSINYLRRDRWLDRLEDGGGWTLPKRDQRTGRMRRYGRSSVYVPGPRLLQLVGMIPRQLAARGRRQTAQDREYLELLSHSLDTTFKPPDDLERDVAPPAPVARPPDPPPEPPGPHSDGWRARRGAVQQLLERGLLKGKPAKDARAKYEL